MDKLGDRKRRNVLQNLIKSFSVDKAYQPAGFFKSFVEKCRLPKQHKLFQRAQDKILKELDLLKFIKSKRM